MIILLLLVKIFLNSADGITYSFGIFLVALIDEFNADRGYASLIPSILVGITLGSGMNRNLSPSTVNILLNQVRSRAALSTSTDVGQ